MTDTDLDALPVRDLLSRLATSDPIPGGGSASALAAAMGAALVEMVVALSVGRPAHAADGEELREIAAAAAAHRTELLSLANEDAAAYQAVVAARRLPRASEAERVERRARVTDATRAATLTPLRTVQVASEVLTLADRVAPIGNPNAASDAGVAGQLASAALRGAALNVRINLPYLDEDDPARRRAEGELAGLLDAVAAREDRVAAAVEARLR
jgi:formiminotetrahydrofolate cyclodeaminase